MVWCGNVRTYACMHVHPQGRRLRSCRVFLHMQTYIQNEISHTYTYAHARTPTCRKESVLFLSLTLSLCVCLSRSLSLSYSLSFSLSLSDISLNTHARTHTHTSSHRSYLPFPLFCTNFLMHVLMSMSHISIARCSLVEPLLPPESLPLLPERSLCNRSPG